MFLEQYNNIIINSIILKALLEMEFWLAGPDPSEIKHPFTKYQGKVRFLGMWRQSKFTNRWNYLSNLHEENRLVWLLREQWL